MGRLAALLGRAALIAAVVGAVLALPAQAAPGDRPILFDSNRGGQVDLWRMNSDGSGLTRLTNDKVEDRFAALSPNGKLIAWTRGGFGPTAEIWVMNSNGTGRRQVTFNQFPEIRVSWSPDGTRLSYRSTRDGNADIYTINIDGTGELRLTTDPAEDAFADWSPDGTRVAFTSDRSGTSAVYTMATDGSDVRRLTPDSLPAGQPQWSPDMRLAFADGFCATCGESDIWVMNADGSGATQVTNTAENELPGGWSKDGTRIVVDFSTLTSGHLSKGDIAVVAVASGATTNLTNTSGINEEHPNW
jgi:Tol biopolymer transport system component